MVIPAGAYPDTFGNNQAKTERAPRNAMTFKSTATSFKVRIDLFNNLNLIRVVVCAKFLVILIEIFLHLIQFMVENINSCKPMIIKNY